MPVRRQEAHRALELLEEYHAKLNRFEDRQLREAIERVITIFKSRLFQALLDIQEFYEETLLNEQKSLAQKTAESNLIAAKWEINPPIISPTSASTYITKTHYQPPPMPPSEEHVIRSTTYMTETTTTRGLGPAAATTTEFSAKSSASPVTSPLAIRTTTPAPTYGSAFVNGARPRTPLGSQYSPTTNDSWLESGEHVMHTVTGSSRPVVVPTVMEHREVYTPNGILYTNGNGLYTDEWEYEDVVLEKGMSGLGFSIAGGTDNPHVPNDSSIYVTKVISGGAASMDGRLRANDVILRVNTTDTVDVPHHVAVDALKRAGNVVKLFVKRRRTRGRTPSPVRAPSPVLRPITPPARSVSPVLPPLSTGRRSDRIELIKGNKGLGFSIAGGVGNEHVPGDPGIFVTKIIDGGAAQCDGRLRVGDRLVAVGGVRLDNVSHEVAVNALRATSDRVVLVVERPQETTLGSAGSPRDTSFYESSTGTTATTYEQRYVPQPSGRRTPQVIRHEELQPYKPASYSTIPRTTTPEMSRAARSLTLQKGHSGLGFNIVGGEDGEGIFISYILPGGAADLSGLLFKGDQLLQVNGEDLTSASHEAAALALKNSGSRVNIVAQYKPEEYQRFEAKIEQIRNEMISQGGAPMLGPVLGSAAPISYPQPRKELYVRALFDYDPARDNGLPSRGLAFGYGDILHVTNASDDEWWQARRILADRREEGYGIIPSKRRVEKRERARRKQVNFSGSRQSSMSEKHMGPRKSMSLSRKFPFMKSKEKIGDESDMEISGLEEPVYSYEVVEEQRLSYVRPVVILGPLKDRMNDDLINEYPDRYASCVPHTSRSRKDHEEDGRDYFFVSREDMETDIQNNLFIEAGQYNGNLYGTSVSSVRTVAQQGKHCILDVSGNAIKRLQVAGLYPIAILIKPLSWQQLIEWNRRTSEEEAQRQFQKAQMLEQEFGEAFTAIINGDTPEEIYAKVREIIREQSGPVVWVPSREQL